jgi:hypothetical protein
MTQDDYTRKLDELDRLMNDPDEPVQPQRVWSILAELSQRDLGPPYATGAQDRGIAAD